jgi:hypothetical protein
MGAKHFHRDRAEIVKNLDLRSSGLAVRGKDSRPEAVAGIMAEFDRGKTKSGSLAEELRAIRHTVGVPAGGEGEALHGVIFQERTVKGDVKAKFGNRKRVGLGFESWGGGWENNLE